MSSTTNPNLEIGTAEQALFDRFKEAVELLQRLERLQKGSRPITRRKPLLANEVIEKYNQDAANDLPGFIADEQARISELLEEVEHRCGLPVVKNPSSAWAACYQESDREEVAECTLQAGRLKKVFDKCFRDLEKAWTLADKRREEKYGLQPK